MKSLLVALFTLTFSLPTHGQSCHQVFADGFGTPGPDSDVFCSVIHDDGNGPALYIGGQFHTVGSVRALGVARWDGTNWSQVGNGLGPAEGSKPAITALASLNGRLYAGGDFGSAGDALGNHFVVWDGVQWAAIPGEPNGTVQALTADQGTLIVGGQFSAAGGSSSGNHIARFDPASSSWSYFGNGINPQYVRCVSTYTTPQGTHVFVGGSAIQIPGGSSSPLVEWNGSNWSAPGGGLVIGNPTIGNGVHAMTVHDEGFGPRLFVAGDFVLAGGIPVGSIAAWDGNTWSAVGSLSSSFGIATFYALHSFDDGTGPALYIGGWFDAVAGLSSSNLVRYRNGGFDAIPTGLGAWVRTLADFHGDLLVGGNQTHLGNLTTPHLSAWRAGTWRAVTSGLAPAGTSPTSFVTYDDGQGPALYAAFQEWPGFSRWSPAGWNSIDPSTTIQPQLLAQGDDGSGAGPSIFAAGAFPDASGVLRSDVARWNSTGWTVLTPAHANNGFTGLCVFDDGSGPKLFVSGFFTSIDGVAANYVARWDGSSWSALANNFPAMSVESLGVHDDGQGPALYVGGWFPGNILRWNGSSWISLGTGLNGSVNAMTSYDDGTGNALYVGGWFDTAGGTPARNIARWKNGIWSNLAGGLSGPSAGVAALCAYDDGSGNALYGTGQFRQAGGTLASGLARWNGQTWDDVHGGFSGPAPLGQFCVNGRALYVHDVGNGPALWIGGSFESAGGVVSSNMARLEPCVNSGAASCSGDGSATPCPCANNSPAGQNSGCLSSFGVGGRLVANGAPSLLHDSLVLSSSDLPNSFALCFQGTTALNGGNGTVFGDGLRCAGGSIVRIYTALNVNGASSYPNGSSPLLHVKGNVTTPGPRTYQVWYRNAAPFCTPAPFNVTNGWTLTWTP